MKNLKRNKLGRFVSRGRHSTPAAKPVLKRKAVKPAAKPVLKRKVAKTAAKPVLKHKVAKPAAKQVLKRKAAKPASKQVLKRKAAKLAAKPVLKSKAAAPAAKPVLKHKAAKPVAKPVLKHKAAKPVAKPVLKRKVAKQASKPVLKRKAAKPAAKPVLKRKAAKPAAKPALKRKASKPAAKPVRKRKAAKPAAKPVRKRKAAKPVAKPASKRKVAKSVSKRKAAKPVAKPPRKRKPTRPNLDVRSRAADQEIQNQLVSLSENLTMLESGLAMGISSMVNNDGTVDGELTVGNLPDEWKELEGVPSLVATISGAFAAFHPFERYPEMGGSFWMSVVVRFGPDNSTELELAASLYKKHHGMFQIGTYPTRADHRTPMQMCLTDDKVGLRSMVSSLMSKRGWPPTALLFRFSWGSEWHPDVAGKRPGHFIGEKGFHEIE